VFHNPLEEPSLSSARSSCRPAVEALEARIVAAAVSPAVLLGAQEALAAFHDLVSLHHNPTTAQAQAVLAHEMREEKQHVLAHLLDQSITAQGVNDAPFQQLDDLFHALNLRVVARARQILAGG
jgi:hypothetical protein